MKPAVPLLRRGLLSLRLEATLLLALLQCRLLLPVYPARLSAGYKTKHFAELGLRVVNMHLVLWIFARLKTACVEQGLEVK